MKTELLRALSLCETDIDGALRRFSGNEDLYVTYLKMFVTEPTMDELNRAIEDHDTEAAFIATHALKGLAGNLGFVPLFHALGVLVLLLRDKKLGEIEAAYAQVLKSYNDIMSAIHVGCDN